MPEVPMNQVVMVPIPLSPEAAERLWQDPAKLPFVGRFVSYVLSPKPGGVDR
jgi:hypothetical protein